MRHAAILALAAVAAAQAPPPRTTHTFKRAGELEIQADVYRLPGDDVRPAILWIHGGALIMGSRANIRRQHLDRYLAEGFVVVSIDYRLAPESKLPAILEDVNVAWKWMQQEGPKLFRIDPRRIAVIGHSAGGYLTLTTGYWQRPRPRALVSFYGYGDIAGDWYAKPDPFYAAQAAVPEQEARGAVGATPLAATAGPNQRGRFYLFTRQRGLWPVEVAGVDPSANPRAFDPWCPARNVTRDYPPTLLLHGDADTDVPFGQSEQMARELAARGVEHELVRIAGGPHGFDRDVAKPEVAAAFEKVVAFLKRHTAAR